MRAMICLAVLVLASLRAAPGRAADEDPKEAARLLYTRGVELANDGRYEAALEQFNAAYAKSPHFAVLYNIGQAHVVLGHPLEAIEALTRYLRDGQEQVPLSRRQQVEAQVGLLESKLAELTVTTDRSGALVRIDGRDVGRTPLYQPLRLAAGAHAVSVTMEGAAPIMQTIVLREAERQALTFVIPGVLAPAAAPPSLIVPAPAPTPPPRRDLRRWAYIAGAAGVVVGAGALGVYLWNRDRYDDWQATNMSLRELVPDSAAYHDAAVANNERADSLTTANHAIVGLSIASAVLIAGGATLYLLDRAQRHEQVDAGARAADSGWSFDVAVGPSWSPRLAWSARW